MANHLKFTNEQAHEAQPREKGYKLAAGAGLYLFVSPTGVKSWRWDYKLDGKRKTLTIGQFPDMPVEAAYWYKMRYAQRLNENGIDPKLSLRFRDTLLDPDLPMFLGLHELYNKVGSEKFHQLFNQVWRQLEEEDENQISKDNK